MANNNHRYYNRSQEPIKCVGLGCSNKATTILLIKYLNKKGTFCQECTTDLIESELAQVFDENDIKNQVHHLEGRKGG